MSEFEIYKKWKNDHDKGKNMTTHPRIDAIVKDAKNIDQIFDRLEKHYKMQENTLEYFSGKSDIETAETQQLTAEIERLNKELSVAKDLVIAGYRLSTYAAAVNFDGSKNELEWCDNLRHRIEEFQQNCKASGFLDGQRVSNPTPQPQTRDTVLSIFSLADPRISVEEAKELADKLTALVNHIYK